MRLFAGELRLLSAESGSFLLLPSGEEVKSIYACGVLTEIKENRQGRILRARVADPTGVFEIYCGRGRMHCASVLAGLSVPSFVMIYARPFLNCAFKQDGIRLVPESVCCITRECRDRWILGTAMATFERLEEFSALYGKDYGIRVLEMAEKALSVADKSTVGDVSLKQKEGLNTDERILALIEDNSTKKGILLKSLYALCESENIPAADAESCIERLVEDGELYLPSGGYVKIL